MLNNAPALWAGMNAAILSPIDSTFLPGGRQACPRSIFVKRKQE
jgi:hypothetical protein